ncbi:MAG: hypothetical protein ACUVXG_12030 [Anaerolineae bacterium]
MAGESSPTVKANLFEGNRANKTIGRGGAILVYLGATIVLSAPDDNTYRENWPDNLVRE